MVHWLVHLHELPVWHHLRELLVPVAVLGLRCCVVLEHLLIEEVRVHGEHLLVWKSHLIWHHHTIWELIHLAHLHHRSRLRHSRRGWGHVRVFTTSSFVIHILSLSVLSQLCLTMGV